MITKGYAGSANEKMTWSQVINFRTLDGGQIQIVPDNIAIQQNLAKELDGDDRVLQKRLEKKLGFSGPTDSQPILATQSVQSMFVMPGAGSFDFKDLRFNNYGDLLVGITYKK